MKQALTKILICVSLTLAGGGTSSDAQTTTEELSGVSTNYVLAVEPIRILAITEYRYHNQLCGKEWQVTTVNGRPSAQPPTWGRLDCGGELKSTQVPHSPVGTVQYYVGEQSFPHLNKDSLAAQLTSALSNEAKVRLVDSSALRRTRGGQRTIELSRHERGPYLVRAIVSELSRSGDSESSGTGISPTTALFGGLTKKKVAAFIRLEVQLISAVDGQIVAAFPVVGTSESSTVGSSLFLGSGSTGQCDQANSITANASREAIEQAAGRIVTELERSGWQGRSS